MFTLKFCSYFEEGGSTESVIACPHYEVYQHRNGAITITTYKNMTITDGVSRQLCTESKLDEDNHSYYQVCFVLNSEGKTIDTIRPEKV